MKSSGLRVLVVNPGTEIGGAELSLLLLLPALRARGVEVVVVTFGEGPFRSRAAEMGFETLTLDLPSAVRSASRYRSTGAGTLGIIAAGVPSTMKLVSMIGRLRIDLVHTNGPKAHLLGGLAGRLARVPVVWHLRDFPPSGFAGQIYRWAARHVPTAIITNSQAVADAYVDPKRACRNVFVALNPVDLQVFRDTRPEAKAHGHVVGQVAHLTPWKGHELFVSIAKEVSAQLPDVSFVIAGGTIYETDGHAGYEARLRGRVSELGLSDRVRFLGARSDMADVLAAVDVLVHCPTEPEPFGRVIAEAMAAARPVVAARSGGIPEIVRDGTTGILVSAGDVSAFASAVIALLKDDARREEFGRAARSRAEALFPTEIHVARVLDAYRFAGAAVPVAA